MSSPFAVLTALGVARRAALNVGHDRFADEADQMHDELSAAIQAAALSDDLAVEAFDRARFLTARLACHPDLAPHVQARMVALYEALTAQGAPDVG